MKTHKNEAKQFAYSHSFSNFKQVKIRIRIRPNNTGPGSDRFGSEIVRTIKICN